MHTEVNGTFQKFYNWVLAVEKMGTDALLGKFRRQSSGPLPPCTRS